MVLDEPWAALSGVSGPALACCFVAAALALRWSSRRTARASAVRARRRQKAALDTMDKAAQRFRLQNPDLDSEALLALPLPQLVQKLHSGDLSPEAVLFTYMGKAWEVNKGTNCVTTYLADCETQLCQLPRQGLLYGVPVSLKECFSYKGQDSTLGLSLNQGVPAEGDCVVVQVLKLQGALPFVHTNVPQSMLSKSGLKGCVYGQVAVQLAVGPMARDVESLALCLRALLCEDMFRLDPTVPPLPFREEIYRSSQPLRIGYYETDNYTMPTPAMKRALLETKQRLEVAGHTLVPFLPSNIPYALETLGMGGLFSDGGMTFLQNFKGDFVDPCLGDSISILRLPGWLKGLLAFMMKPLVPRLSAFLNNMKSRSAGKLWELHHEIEVYRHSVMAQWRALELDVLLTPMLGPALDLNGPGKATGCEEERGAARGCAVRGSALAGRAVSAVHAGGGAADEPGQAAILTAAHPALEDPRPAWSCIQPSQGTAAAPPGSIQPGLRLPSPSPLPPTGSPDPLDLNLTSSPGPLSVLTTPLHCGSQRA
ncbi:fatty-acid amide hydrolase 1 isoform X3 [Moschus berezovskii]|uniref:fatty-acid amide hydrolase 1 isoform X3 n=1 Tax=Moschus berezovskii TaxID=68408 RepID=UPI0024440793|nr:fatty-acid amide hydrolase 1 isoform X3 [Moschus berezovskii]